MIFVIPQDSVVAILRIHLWGNLNRGLIMPVFTPVTVTKLAGLSHRFFGLIFVVLGPLWYLKPCSVWFRPICGLVRRPMLSFGFLGFNSGGLTSPASEKEAKDVHDILPWMQNTFSPVRMLSLNFYCHIGYRPRSATFNTRFSLHGSWCMVLCTRFSVRSS